MARRLTIRALVPLAVLLLAGCGSDGAGSSADAQRLLGETFGAAKPIRSGRLSVTLNVAATGLQSLKRPLSLRLAGPFQTQPAKTPQFDFDLSFASGGSNLAAGAVSTGSEGFLKLGGHAYRLAPGSFKALARSGATSGKGGVSLKSLGVDPRRWVRDVTDLGEEDVAGTATIHLRAGIDVPALLGDVDTVLRKAGGLGLGAASTEVPGGLSTAQRKQIVRSVDRAQVDVWTGKADHTLRRLAIDVRFDVPADLRKRGSAPERGTVRLDLSLAQLGVPQPIAAPAHPRPLSELTAALAQLAAQTQQQSGGSASPGASGSKYDRCVAAAGDDLAKVQRCSSLLGH